MISEDVDYNWCPSYTEFCREARQGRVRLNIDGHETWLYKTILPFSALRSLFSSESYEERIRGLMIDDEEIFRKVHHKKGIDLILLPS